MTDIPENPAPIGLTDDERRLLQLAVVANRVLSKGDPEPKSSSTWKEILNSTVVATLITVALGGIVGNLIISNYQEKAKDHERELTAQTDLLKRQEDVAISSYQLLGDAHYHAAAILALTRPEMQPFNVPKEQKESLMKRRTAVANAADAFLQKWGREKYTSGMLLRYFNDEGVREAWTSARDATEAMLGSAQKQYGDYVKNPKAPQRVSIAAEESKFSDAVNGLARALEKARSAVSTQPR